MNFKELVVKLQKHFEEMVKNETHLFEVEVDKDELWNLYLDSFPPGTNEIYRERREYDCCYCRHFIKNIGNAVVIKDNKIITIWDLDIEDATFKPVVDSLSEYIKSKTVVEVYVSKMKRIGTSHNYEERLDGKTHKFEHFCIDLPDGFVDRSSRSEGDIKGTFRDTRNVFKRSLDEITEDSLLTVLELIAQNSLYKGEEWKGVLTEFLKYKKEYDKLGTDDEKANYAWEQSVKVGGAIGRIRNHSIGTLLTNISEDMDLDLAVKKYEDIVAGVNYKRPNPIFPKRQVEALRKYLEQHGYMNSLPRRFATLDDLSINNILFSNRNCRRRIEGTEDIFSELKKEVFLPAKKFSKIEEIPVKDFIENVLPMAKEIEAFVENKHGRNFVSMIAPVNAESKTMFKWNNGLSWAYTGNITDSDMKANVKNAGGNVDGVLRFSIQWNDSGSDNSDLDAHCIEPNGNKIYFGNCRKPNFSRLGGQLDVDVTQPNYQRPGQAAVENITWADKTRMVPGTYKFFINQYAARGSKGFKAEVEFEGEIRSFEYNKPLRTGENVQVAEITLDENGNFTINEKLSGNTSISSKEIWGVNTNQFVPVSVICYSPNYFDEQDGIGHRHLFFMLKGCINTEEPNGYYNEFLRNEFNEYRRVFEALGAKCHATNADDQLSGIGFSMTKRGELIVKVKGVTQRILKIKF